MRGTYRLALLAGLLTVSPATLGATELARPDEAPESGAVRVINNYVGPIMVYVEDAQGHLHRMGRVGRSHVEMFEIAPEVADLGEYQIKVFPNEPVWSPVVDDFGVRTRYLNLEPGQVLNFWVEPDLTKSRIEYTGG